jgi:hypothetical protein
LQTAGAGMGTNAMIYVNFGSVVVRADEVTWFGAEDTALRIGLRSTERLLNVNFPTVKEANDAFLLMLKGIEAVAR